MDPSDEILAMLSMALMEVNVHVHYEDAREAKEAGKELEVDRNDKGCTEVTLFTKWLKLLSS